MSANKMLPDVGSIPLIAPVHDPYVSSFPGQFFAGQMNPLKKRTVIKHLNIDTRFRDNYDSTSATDFTMQLPVDMNNVLSMGLSSVELPQSYYVIQENCHNNFFHLKASSMTHSERVSIPSGNYTPPQLVDALQARIDDIIGGFTVSLHEATNRIKIASGDTFELNFGNGRSLMLRLGWIMGFRKESYTGDTIYVSEGEIDLNGPRYFYLCIDDHNKSVSNGFYSAFNSSVLNNNILAKLTWREFIPGSIFARDNLSIVYSPREYFGPVNLTNLHVRLVDEYGRVVNLREMDFSFCLSLVTQYDI